MMNKYLNVLLAGWSLAAGLIIAWQHYQAPRPTLLVCGVPALWINRFSLDTTRLQNKMVIASRYAWKKSELKVFFVGNEAETLKDRTLAVANEWSQHANIRFTKAFSKSSSDLRVSFRQKNGYFSLIGTEASQGTNAVNTTMWLENLDTKPEEEFRRVVLHEFGHALALLHELQSPAAVLPWDTAAVYAHFRVQYGWDTSQVNQQVLRPIPTGEYTRFDPQSIMIYALPASLFKDGQAAITWPSGLSRLDAQTIRTYYP